MRSAHVFVIQADLTNLACDAWMLPTDRAKNLSAHWHSVPGVRDALDRLVDAQFGRGKVLARALELGDASQPVPIATAVPFDGIVDPADITEPLRAFIAEGAFRAARRRASPGSSPLRPRPLLAMPFFGVSGGGGGALRGALLKEILETGRSAADEAGIDLALVLRDPRAFALAQVLRKQDRDRSWPSLIGTPREGHLLQLSQLARAGRLVPFMGAGVSVSAGAPSWDELLRRLARRMNLDDETTEALFRPGRDALDQAAYLRAVFIDSKDPEDRREDGGFAEAIAEEVSMRRYGLAPALLAGLGTEQAITLNYDELFELAARDAGDPRTVIPDGFVESDSKWLLKLHGSVTNADTIVLTRDDYLGFSASRDALSAIVKATLITHHLLFVGFGLADDHFHQILHDVKQAVPPGLEGRSLATALKLSHDPLDTKLWAGQLSIVPMAGESIGIDEASRELEIFLDALLAFSTDSRSYLLNPDYANVLSEHDDGVRRLLLDVVGAVTHEQRQTDAWQVVERALVELGLDQPPSRTAVAQWPWRDTSSTRR